jgi:hypothetical protein
MGVEVQMATVELTNQQVAELVRQLSPEQKREVLLALAGDADARRDERMTLAQEQLRQRAQARGCDWNTMTDDQREALVDELIHEDRSCPR